MYDSNRNPLRNLIPASLNQPVLLNSILALSARHMENAGQSFQARVSTSPNALWFKYKAIRGLSQALNDASLCRQDTTVASAFLLIFLDLLESGSDKWDVHLEGIKRLIAQVQPPSSTGTQQDLGQTVQGLRDFISRQIYLYVYWRELFPNLYLLFSLTANLESILSEQPSHVLGYCLTRLLCSSHGHLSNWVSTSPISGVPSIY